MKLSFDWLSDYVDLSGLTPEEVAEKLTMGAFEVEEIKRVGGSGITGDIVVGEILDIRQHPNAEKIRLTTIRISETEEPRQIVCGAWNIEVGHRIPVALPGAKVLNRHDGSELVIKESKIRGELSCGMLCSAPELGIEGSGEGILLLDKETAIGTNAKELLGISQDAVLHVAPRSNRGDALSVLGLAREVAALCGRPLREPQWRLDDESATSGNGDGAEFSLGVEHQDECPYFTIRLLSNVKVGPSPEWLVKRLEAIGMRTINNVVDITNYVMQELGQPLHAYNLDRLDGKHLEVRRARPGEKLVTIDEKERSLTDEIMMIADRQKTVGVAGVMGGKGSEIDNTTEVVALEAAAFNPVRVRRSSRLLGLSSDSSSRFERGVDIASVKKASDRAAYLMVKYCGAKLGTFHAAGDHKVTPLNIPMRLSEITRLCDIEVDGATVEKLLTPLGFKVLQGLDRFGQPQVNVEVPSFRMRDIAREVDLVEEVVRLYGYDRVPESMPKRTVAPPKPEKLSGRVKHALSACGLNEAWNSSLVSLSDLTGRGFAASGNAADQPTNVLVLNPLSDEHQALRTSLLPGLMKAAAYNQDRGQRDVWIFELGLVYRRDTTRQKSREDSAIDENTFVSALITGDQTLGIWAKSSAGKTATKDAQAVEFYTLKGVLENLFERLSIPQSSIQFVAPEQAPGWFHPSRSCQIVFKPQGRDSKQQKNAQPLVFGWLGEAHPAIAEAYGLKNLACIFELNVDSMRQAISHSSAFEEMFHTPAVVRDLTADLPRTTEQSAVAQAVSQYGGKLLRKVELVSVFDLSDEKKSLSYRLVFQHPEETLTADKVEDTMTKIRNQLARQLSAEFRA